MTLDPKTIIFALIGGIIPAIVWLWFWLKEDDENPEPKRVIVLSFVMGGLAVFLAFVLDNLYVAHILHNPQITTDLKNINVDFSVWRNLWSSASPFLAAFVGFAFIEEAVKFFAARFFAFTGNCYDEPVDAMVYMITAAVGFAAFENTLFLFNVLTLNGTTTDFLLTGNLRFLGSTLLHISSSAIVGAAIGLSFYSSKFVKVVYTTTGLVLATMLHAVFNFFIIINSGVNIFKVLLALWLIAILIIIFFEKVKLTKKYV